MPPKKTAQPEKFDYRAYLGIVVFRWKLIVLCFLWAILAGVLFIRFSEKKFNASGTVRIYKEKMKELPSPRAPISWAWHQHLVQGRCRSAATRALRDGWVDVVGSAGLSPAVRISWIMGLEGVINFSTSCPNPAYAKVYLQRVMEEHRNAWEDRKRATLSSATKILNEELVRLGDYIAAAEDDVIEYQRINRMPVIEARANLEEAMLATIIARKNSLKMQQFLLEVQNPLIKDVNAGVLHNVNMLTQQSGSGKLIGMAKSLANQIQKAGLTGMLDGDPQAAESDLVEPRKYTDLRIQLHLLEAKEEELAARFEDQHPTLSNVRSDIRSVEGQLDVEKKMQLEQILNRNHAVSLQLKALEDAEYAWEGRYYATSRQKAEFAKVRANLGRYEGAYHTIYSRIFDLQVSEEMKAEHYEIMHPAHASTTPSWPDAKKILMVALVMGLGGGFGLAFVIQFVDNKVQTIKDVEEGLGLPFLGGVPYWVHSDLERTVRPIVTEEFSAGAVEAYRALRTSILTAADKAGEKIIIMTSADSKEGKTLTSLNLAIMIAQAGKKVLLVDMDLRRGRLHRSIETERSPGVTEALKEGWPLEDVVLSTRYENLSFAPAGENTELIAENLHGCDLQAFFKSAEKAHDYVIIDSAPVLRVTDTVILATQQLGVVVYVAHVNRTPKPLIKYSLDLLVNARILGVIMNSIEMHTISGIYYSYQYPNYAYYSNAYAYGYTYGYYHDEGTPDAKRKWKRPPRAGGSKRSLLGWIRKTMLPTE